MSYGEYELFLKRFGICPAPLSSEDLFSIFNNCAISLTMDAHSKVTVITLIIFMEPPE